MPIEIRELQIVTVVEEGTASSGSPAPAAASQEKIIAACVEQVLDILRQKNER